MNLQKRHRINLLFYHLLSLNINLLFLVEDITVPGCCSHVQLRGCIGFKIELFTHHNKTISSGNRKESNKAEVSASCCKFLLSWLIFCYKAVLDAMFVLDFPGDSASEGLTCQGRQRGFISCMEKFPWRRKWQPTPVFFLGNPIEKGAWQATVHRVTKSQTRLRRGAQRSNRLCYWFIQSFS